MTELETMSQTAQFDAIKTEVDEAFERHISRVGRNTISLDPYALVPLDDYDSLRSGYEDHVSHWDSNNIDIRPVIRATLLVDAATEENLPWYTSHIEAGFESWHEWNGRWTAEERSHGEIMLRDIEARGILDMSKEWLPIREQNMASGIHPKVTSLADGVAYVATQELLTKDAHFQSARLMDAPGSKTLRAIGSDEGRHYQFYMSALKALSKVVPDTVLVAMRHQHENDSFAMPGQKGINGYSGLARTIALSGVFDALTILEAQKKTIDEAGLLDSAPVTDEGKKAQEWAHALSAKEDITWQRKRKLMEITRQRAFSSIGSSSLRPFILGYSVEIKNNSFVPIAE
ncbi:MAG: acyl-ACP desaturase [Candidatus Saccharibacteria bacterium]